jgi:hypothetical protein
MGRRFTYRDSIRDFHTSRDGGNSNSCHAVRRVGLAGAEDAISRCKHTSRSPSCPYGPAIRAIRIAEVPRRGICDLARDERIDVPPAFSARHRRPSPAEMTDTATQTSFGTERVAVFICKLTKHTLIT